MKFFCFFCFFLFFAIFIGCKQHEYSKIITTNTQTQSWDIENLDKFNQQHLCNNQLYLINNKDNNFNFNLDSLQNGDAYFILKHKEIRKIKSNNNEVTFDIIPYTEINDIIVSFGKSLIKPRGSCYFSSHSERFLRINFEEESIYWKTNNYFSTFNKEYTNTLEEMLPVPIVSLNMTDFSFAPVKPALINIYSGYLQAMEKHSMIFFQKKVCKLELNQLDSLKKWFPLRIRLTRSYKSSLPFI